MFELANAGNGRIYTVSSCRANLKRNSGVGLREAAKVGILGLDELQEIEDDSPLKAFQPSSNFQLSYFNENFILALYEAIFPLSSSLTSNSVTSPILRFQRDSDAASMAFLAASSQLVGDDPTSSITVQMFSSLLFIISLWAYIDIIFGSSLSSL